MGDLSPRILVVEDEIDIRGLIVLHLKRSFQLVDEVSSGEDALEKINTHSYDLLILDWMLPEISGLQITQIVRQGSRNKDAAILMVTAKAEAGDIVQGLDAGADDYLTKPFEPAVLIARVKALLRRSQTESPSPSVIRLGNLEIDSESFEARCHSQKVPLTRSEFKLLLALAQNQGKVLTREKLIDLVQGEGVAVVDRAVDTHIFGLRKKLGECSEVVETIRGVGYRIRG